MAHSTWNQFQENTVNVIFHNFSEEEGFGSLDHRFLKIFNIETVYVNGADAGFCTCHKHAITFLCTIYIYCSSVYFMPTYKYGAVQINNASI